MFFYLCALKYAFLLGHTSQLVYYRWFHPSGPIQFRASSPASVEEVRRVQFLLKFLIANFVSVIYLFIYLLFYFFLHQIVCQAGVILGEQPIPSFSPVFMIRTLKHMNRKFSGVRYTECER